ncbi:hypothetical protein [Azospirillum sp. A39]|uniref:hypothetical protein n=1 Tax=Azospirillum sp. A39 TaxID=3462279 RepID=UPI0040467518
MSTTVPPPSTPGLVPLTIMLSGQRTADTTAACRTKLPFPAKLLAVHASARASGGTAPTLAVDVKAGATSLLSAPVAVTAGATAEATVAGAGRIADEADITVDLDIGGTTPTWDDIAVVLWLQRV